MEGHKMLPMFSLLKKQINLSIPKIRYYPINGRCNEREASIIHLLHASVYFWMYFNEIIIKYLRKLSTIKILNTFLTWCVLNSICDALNQKGLANWMQLYFISSMI